MRTRIALATAVAVTFTITITSTLVDPLAAGAASPQKAVRASRGADGPPSVLDPLLVPLGLGATRGTGAQAQPVEPAWRALAQSSAQAGTQAPTDATSTDTADWQCIRVHESGDAYNDPTRPSGAYGILEVTWQSNGYSGWPYEGTAAQQNALALKLYNEYGWAPWSSRYACGL